jgi:hypothetical protein
MFHGKDAEAEAVVTSVKRLGFPAIDYDVGMRVRFEDGTTAEVVQYIGGMTGTDLTFRVGDIVPVRYHPHNRHKFKLDENALRARQRPALEELQRHRDEIDERAVREAEAKLAARERPPHDTRRLP